MSNFLNLSQQLSVSNNLWIETIDNINHDIYHLPGYCHLEAQRIQAKAEAILIKDNDRVIFLPYLLRACHHVFNDQNYSHSHFDITSPYGYTGIIISDAATKDIDFLEVAMQEISNIMISQGICSAFLRLHPILNQNITDIFPSISEIEFYAHGQTVSVDLSISEEEIWRQTKSDRRNKINKCKRVGMIARMVDFEDYLHEFVAIYSQTMDRVDASGLYYDFDYDYYLQMKKILGNNLHLCIVEMDGEIASVGLYTEYSGIVQALFGGTRKEFIKLSPNSLEIDFVRYWAKSRGNYLLHLGGGLGGVKNSLYTFKGSFSQLRHNFLTMRWIIDREKYHELVLQRAKELNTCSQKLLNSGFFPAYRAK